MTDDGSKPVLRSRGDACSRDGEFNAPQLAEMRSQNLNGVEHVVARDFYAKALGREVSGPAQANATAAPAVVSPALEDTLSVVQVCYVKDKGLFARVGLVPRPSCPDWRDRAVAIYHSLGNDSNLRAIDIKIDTMPLMTVDQIVALSGVRVPDFVVLDAKQYGVPVLYGAMRTLIEHRPLLLFSANPPGWVCDYDTVEHYVRFVDIMSYVNYWLVSHPNTYDYIMQYAEVPNA